MSENQKRVEICVSGIVQGVFYRASTLEQAQSLNIVGTVKNNKNGTVEVIAEGREYALLDLVKWCRLGPPSAKVEDLDIIWLESREEFQTFSIVRE